MVQILELPRKQHWINVLKRSNECDSVENSQGQSKTTEVANSVIAEGTFSVVHMQTA